MVFEMTFCVVNIKEKQLNNREEEKEQEEFRLQDLMHGYETTNH